MVGARIGICICEDKLAAFDGIVCGADDHVEIFGAGGRVGEETFTGFDKFGEIAILTEEWSGLLASSIIHLSISVIAREVSDRLQSCCNFVTVGNDSDIVRGSKSW